jgi:hypothetical protein
MPIIHIEEIETSLLTLFGCVPGFMEEKGERALSNPCFMTLPLTSQHLNFQSPITLLFKIFVRSRRD